MSDPVAFLTARLNEDEAAIRDERYSLPGPDKEFSRERLLREVAAKRAILAEYEKAERETDRLIAGGFGEPEDATSWRLALELSCKLLAAVYRDHPDYDPEWATSGSSPTSP